MSKWYRPAMAAVGCALMAVPLLAFARPDEKVDDDKDKAQARKELKDLEDQRTKLDSRIRDLRKKAGLPNANAFVFGDGKLMEIPGLGGDHSIIIQKAMGDAHRAVEEAMKNLPKNFEKFNFDFDPDKQGDNFKLFIDKDGKQYKWDNKMSDEEKKKFKEQMEQMKIEIRENLKGLKDLKELKDLKIQMPEIHSFSDGRVLTPRVVTPKYRVIEPRLRGESDDSRALRDELRSLRDEVQKLRDEVRKGRGGTGSRDNLNRFDEINLL